MMEKLQVIVDGWLSLEMHDPYDVGTLVEFNKGVRPANKQRGE